VTVAEVTIDGKPVKNLLKKFRVETPAYTPDPGGWCICRVRIHPSSALSGRGEWDLGACARFVQAPTALLEIIPLLSNPTFVIQIAAVLRL
jgi:hypothetical protein